MILHFCFHQYDTVNKSSLVLGTTVYFCLSVNTKGVHRSVIRANQTLTATMLLLALPPVVQPEDAEETRLLAASLAAQKKAARIGPTLLMVIASRARLMIF
jgi:hypothetical protein